MITRVAPILPQQEQQRGAKPEKCRFKAIATKTMGPISTDSAERIGSTEKTPDVGKYELSESPYGANRIDYTDIVKRKYFEQPEENHDGSYPILMRSTSIPENAASVDGSFDHGLLSAVYAKVDSTETNHHPQSTDIKNRTAVGEDRNRIKSSYGPLTPPLSLYMDGVPPLSTSSLGGPLTPNNNNSNPDTDESAGPLSPGPGMEVVYSNDYYDPNSIRSLSTAFNRKLSSDDVAVVGSQGSVASSRGSVSTATHSSLIKQPVLYSAIGSLEHVNRNSLTNLNKRFLAPSKEFCKPGAVTAQQSILIPPARVLPAREEQQLEQQQQQKNKPGSTSALHTRIRSAAAGEGNTPSKQQQQSDLGLNGKQNTADDGNRGIDGKPHAKTEAGTKPSIYKSQWGQDRRKSDSAAVPSNGDKTNATSADSKNQSNSGGKQNSNSRRSKLAKRVSYDPSIKTRKSQTKKIEMFRPSSDAYTPRIERKKIKYKEAEARPSVQHMSSPMGTLQRPNFRDALRRVAMIIHQHIVKIESRFEQQEFTDSVSRRRRAASKDGLFHASMRDTFNEEAYRTPTYKCNMARIPMARPGMVYGLRKVKVQYTIPTETEIYDFGHQLFKTVQLSSECSIVCLIYVERLMEVAKVPLLACTWRPIFMCGLLLASKVWQDLSSWNIEFSSVYPQFSLEAINKLELNFLRSVKWDLYISSSSYAKYYFALRSLTEKQDFRQRYNRMVGGVGNVAQAEAMKVQERTERVKEEALLKLSRSM